MKDTILGPGAIEWPGGNYRTTLATADTGGAMSITDSVSLPRWGPPRHVHHDADELFVLLTSDPEFRLERVRIPRGPGQTAFVSRGRENTFRGGSDVPSRPLVILTRGGLEGGVAKLAAGRCRIPEDMAEITRIAAEHQLMFTGPPPGAEMQETLQ